MEYEDNVAWTALMAARAHGAGVAVEAELGKLAGEEDGLSVSEIEAKMTDPDQVRWEGICSSVALLAARCFQLGWKGWAFLWTSVSSGPCAHFQRFQVYKVARICPQLVRRDISSAFPRFQRQGFLVEPPRAG